jgi:hypothetical protein
MRELNPELKPRFLREAMKIIGDHPDGKKSREQLAYYDDLINEIQLNLSVDGSTDVGRGEPFGAIISIWCTRAASRETGGFGKYVSNDQYHPMTGQQVDYKDDFEKHIREKLADSFDVISITFNKPAIQPMSLPRTGWEQHPLAYLVLKPKDSSIDRIPQLKLDMDFSDGNGLVILPVTSAVALINANAKETPARALSDVTIEQTLDDRRGSDDGKVRVEIHAKAKGLVPDVNQLVDLSATKGFQMASRDDHGLNVVEMDSSGDQLAPVSERSWTIDFKPSSQSLAMTSFTFPAAKAEDYKVTLKRYADADIVDAKSTVQIASVGGKNVFRRIALAASLVVIASLLALWIVHRRRSQRAVAAPRFLMPTRITPVDAIALLRKIHAANGEALRSAEQVELKTTIDDLERRYFAPTPVAAGGTAADLESVVRTWVQRAAAM